jgi:hypothetical protein
LLCGLFGNPFRNLATTAMQTQWLSPEYLLFEKHLFSEHLSAEKNRGKLDVGRSRSLRVAIVAASRARRDDYVELVPF